VTSYSCNFRQEQENLTTAVHASSAMNVTRELSAQAGTTHVAWPTNVVATIVVGVASKGNQRYLQRVARVAVKDYRSL
jgi:hypothetical protein